MLGGLCVEHASEHCLHVIGNEFGELGIDTELLSNMPLIVGECLAVCFTTDRQRLTIAWIDAQR